MTREPTYSAGSYIRERRDGTWTAWSWHIATGQRFATRAEAEAWLVPLQCAALASAGMWVA